jgi:hypothetical protein
MTTISLRTLVREPRKVKRMTRAGKSVQVTDKGKPLWILQPANSVSDEAERLRVTDEILDEVLREPPPKISAARLLEESREPRILARHNWPKRRG